MIVCRDCKYLWGELKKLQKENRELEDALAERADGLQVCCETCRHLAYGACLKGYHCTGNILLNKMLCPEWQPREEKE